MRVVIGDELTSTVMTELLLLTLSIEAILGDVTGTALRAGGGASAHFYGDAFTLILALSSNARESYSGRSRSKS